MPNSVLIPITDLRTEEKENLQIVAHLKKLVKKCKNHANIVYYAICK